MRDEAMPSDADLTETEVAETLDHEWYAKGNEYYLFSENEIIYLVYMYVHKHHDTYICSFTYYCYWPI